MVTITTIVKATRSGIGLDTVDVAAKITVLSSLHNCVDHVAL